MAVIIKTIVAGVSALIFASCPALADERVEALIASLPDGAREVMPKLNSDGRRLLALRTYLRGKRRLAERWSWSEDEIEAYAVSDARKIALEAVAKVTTAFEAENPGYTLYVNTRVRSLDVQVNHWNRNASVTAAAADIALDVDEWLTDNPDEKAAALRNFLVSWKPGSSVAIAAPGMSAHGQGLAYDFQIMQDGAIIAGANTRIIDDIWIKDGWAKKLKLAVKTSTAPFTGPLTRPVEPWHYKYEPPAD